MREPLVRFYFSLSFRIVLDNNYTIKTKSTLFGFRKH